MTIHTSHSLAGFGEVVLIDPDKNERGNNQQEQQDHDELGMLADGFEHGQSFCGSKNKGELTFASLTMVKAVRPECATDRASTGH